MDLRMPTNRLLSGRLRTATQTPSATMPRARAASTECRLRKRIIATSELTAPTAGGSGESLGRMVIFCLFTLGHIVRSASEINIGLECRQTESNNHADETNRITNEPDDLPIAV